MQRTLEPFECKPVIGEHRAAHQLFTISLEVGVIACLNRIVVDQEILTVPNDIQIPLITPEQYALAMRLGSIFMPRAAREIETLYTADADQTRRARFVHYTSAEAALKIINSKRFWMRNTNCMPDYREVRHGFDIFRTFFADAAKQKAFIAALDNCAPGVAQEAINLFDQSWAEIHANTYIASISTYDPDEDQYGRLSMWRDSAASARVGLFCDALLYGKFSRVEYHFDPVEYRSDTSARNILDEVIVNILGNLDFLRSFERGVVVQTVFLMFLAGVVCLKHEGFGRKGNGEQYMNPAAGRRHSFSQLQKPSKEFHKSFTKIPLDEKVSAAVADLEFSRIFERLIIGPTQYALPMKESFTDALTKAGIADAANRVSISGIPIRT